MRIINQPITYVIVDRIFTAAQLRFRCSSPVGKSAHLHTVWVETNTVIATKTFSILEKEHLPAFTFKIFHLFVGKKPGIRNASVYLCNLYLQIIQILKQTSIEQLAYITFFYNSQSFINLFSGLGIIWQVL